MPICRTCRGEYTRQECLCPSCKKPLGRGANLCHRCGADTGGKRLCPRCKSDVSGWEQENFSLNQFMFKGGAVGLLPSLVALALWLTFWSPKGASLHHPLDTLFSVGMSQLVIIILYIKRLFWRERWWASQIYRVAYPPMVLAIGGTFTGAVILAALSFVLYKVWDSPSYWEKLLFGVVYGLSYVLLTASLTLLALHDYADRLDQRVPQPIFVHTERLLRVAVETAIQSLNVLNGADVQEVGAHKGSDRSYEILEVIRNSDDGGIRVLLREFKLDPVLHGGARGKESWVERAWRIEADQWGRTHSLQLAKGEGGPPLQ